MSQPLPLRVVIADTHAVMRDGLKLILRELGRTTVVGETDDGIEAMELCRRLQPELIVMDLPLRSLDGIDVIAGLRRRSAATAIVVLSSVRCPERAQAAIKAGAHGVLLRRSGVGEFAAALKQVESGRQYVDPAIVAAVHARDAGTPSGAAAVRITARERQVLKLIAEGKRTRRIAEELFVSIKTVETHRLNVMKKLDAHSIPEVVSWACRLGLAQR